MNREKLFDIVNTNIDMLIVFHKSGGPSKYDCKKNISYSMGCTWNIDEIDYITYALLKEYITEEWRSQIENRIE